MSNVYPNYNETESYYNDGRMHTAYPVIMDADGRKIRYPPTHNSEGYVMKAERVVEQVTRVPVVSIVMADYRYSNSEPNEKLELVKDNVAYKRYSQLGSSDDQAEKVGDFFTKVQNEASQPTKVATTTGPYLSNWRARKLVGIPVGDKTVNNEAISLKSQDKNPSILNTRKDMNINFNDRPNNEGPFVPNRQLSRPTNDIKTAVELQTEGLRPNQSDNSKPETKVIGPLSYIHWRNAPSTLSAQSPPKSISKEDDYKKPNEEGQMYGRDNLGGIYRGAANKMNEREPERIMEGNMKPAYNWHGKPAPPPKSFGVPPMQPKDSFPAEAIDSSEARRGYGKMKPQPMAEETYPRIIDSEELIKKYNGAKVPW